MKKTPKQKVLRRWSIIQRRLERVLKHVEASPMTPASIQLRADIAARIDYFRELQYLLH
jgi:hypothetical protein